MSVALPSELDFSLPSSLPDHRSYELRTMPTNASSFSTAGSPLQLSLPQLQRSFYQSNTMYLTGRLTVTTAGAGGADALPIYMNPAGIYGCFSKWVVKSATGQTLDTIDNPGYVANVSLNVGLTSAERRSCANTMLLNESDDDSNVGMAFNLDQAGNTINAGQGKVLDFTMPMIGLLNNDKTYLPAYGGGEIQLELTLAPPTAWAITSDAGTSIATFTFSNIELVSQVLEFSPASFEMIKQQYGSKITLKSETYSFGSTTLAAQSQGTVDIPFSIRCSSLKRLFVICSPSNVAEGVGYGSVNPNLSGLSFVNNGQSFPNRPVQCQRASETFAQLQKAFGGLYSADKSSQISIAGFRRASTAYTPSVYMPYNSSKANLTTHPNKWFFVLDLESLSNHKNTMYNGLNTSNSSSNFIRLDINSQLANVSHTVAYFSCHDVLLNIDLETGIISAIV